MFDTETGQPSSQCKSHDAGGTTQPINEAYGAQLRRSTSPTAFNSEDRRGLRRSTQPIHKRYDVPRPMPTGGAEQSSLPWNVIIYNFPGYSAAETPYKVQQQWTTESRLLTTAGSWTEPHPRLRNGHPDVQGVQIQRSNMSFACTECFGPLNIEKTHYGQESRQALLFKQPQKTIMKVRRSTLKILKSKTRKRDNQYSECDDKEETYAYYNETL